MFGKIKITQAQADAIEEYLECGDVVEMLEVHAGIRADKNNNWVIEFKTLNSLSMADLARALLIGYEVEPEYKDGDWIVFVNAVNESLVCIIENVGNSSVDTDYVGSNGYKQSFGKKRIRLATPEEIKAEKERRVWESIGRGVKEFRVGDIIELKNQLGFRIYHEKQIEVAVRQYEIGDVTGFCPIESLVSFEECDSK